MSRAPATPREAVTMALSRTVVFMVVFSITVLIVRAISPVMFYPS